MEEEKTAIYVRSDVVNKLITKFIEDINELNKELETEITLGEVIHAIGYYLHHTGILTEQENEFKRSKSKAGMFGMINGGA